jgi:CHASE2 domain-containing sensor protein
MRAPLVIALCWVCVLLAAGPAQATEAGAKAQGVVPSAYVSVAGAPGDGEQALAAALAKRLSAMGVKQATAFEANIYDIQGTVRVSPAQGGKETVTIIWVVLDPDGNQLGVTRQTKDVKKGSLDKKWGRAADAAAAAAAADIVKLLPEAGR